MVNYVKDGKKTEQELFCQGINCNPSTAREQFVTVKEQFDKPDGIQAYHGYLSFKETDITPELAQHIGMEFAKRVRKYGAYASGITQNVDDLLQSHTARTMLANSEFIIMLNQASTDRIELAKLLNISDTQLSYITNVDAGHGLIKVGSSLVPFANKFPKNTKLYKLMTTKLSDIAN